MSWVQFANGKDFCKPYTAAMKGEGEDASVCADNGRIDESCERAAMHYLPPPKKVESIAGRQRTVRWLNILTLLTELRCKAKSTFSSCFRLEQNHHHVQPFVV